MRWRTRGGTWSLPRREADRAPARPGRVCAARAGDLVTALVRVVRDPSFAALDFGPGHPMAPVRLVLAMALADELGLLRAPGVEVVGAPLPGDDVDLEAVHDPSLVEAVRAASARPSLADGRFGLGTVDVPAFVGMHDAARRVVAASADAARAVWRGEALHAVNLAGGMHHALRARASGFCIYNDAAAALAALLADGCPRVAYVDVDAHHGDGVEEAFVDDPRVLTVSVHESGETLFPGTGVTGDAGGPAARGTALSWEVPAGTSDAPWAAAVTSALERVEDFAPEVVVSQHGADSHRDDPLTHLEVSVDAQRWAAMAVHEVAHRAADGRWLALGGGGYSLVDVVPRAWAHVVGIAAHVPVGLAEPVPRRWLEQVLATTGLTGPSRMGDRA